MVGGCSNLCATARIRCAATGACNFSWERCDAMPRSATTSTRSSVGALHRPPLAPKSRLGGGPSRQLGRATPAATSLLKLAAAQEVHGGPRRPGPRTCDLSPTVPPLHHGAFGAQRGGRRDRPRLDVDRASSPARHAPTQGGVYPCPKSRAHGQPRSAPSVRPGESSKTIRPALDGMRRPRAPRLRWSRRAWPTTTRPRQTLHLSLSSLRNEHGPRTD